MKVGHGVTPIPVPVGSEMGGYMDRPGRSTGIADVLEAHVVTVTSSERRFALVVLDVVCVNVDLAAAVRSALTALGIDDVWVCASHTHSGPETGCLPRGTTTPLPWLDVCVTAARAAATSAVAGELTGTLSRATVDVSGVASVRSVPDAARSVPVDVVSFRTSGGHVAGLLVVLPVHPTVLPATSTVVSADLTGAVRRALLGAGAASWVVVAPGASGDLSTRGVRQAADLAECARLGQVVAGQVLAATPAPVADGPVLTATAEVVVVPGQEPEFDRRAKAPTSRIEETLWQAMRLRRYLGHSDQPMAATVHAARLGDLRLIGLPGEPFLGLRTRARATLEDVVVLGYVGGYVGYLPTREAFAGESTYETLMSPVAAGEPERLVDIGTGLLLQLRH